jgi:hypothetical protein
MSYSQESSIRLILPMLPMEPVGWATTIRTVDPCSNLILLLREKQETRLRVAARKENRTSVKSDDLCARS